MHRQIFVAEVVCTHVEEVFISESGGRNSIDDLIKLDPILYGLDNHYYSIGSQIGIGYQETKNIWGKIDDKSKSCEKFEKILVTKVNSHPK